MRLLQGVTTIGDGHLALISDDNSDLCDEHNVEIVGNCLPRPPCRRIELWHDCAAGRDRHSRESTLVYEDEIKDKGHEICYIYLDDSAIPSRRETVRCTQSGTIRT